MIFTQEEIKTKDDLPVAVIATQTITKRIFWRQDTLLDFVKPFLLQTRNFDCLQTVERQISSHQYKPNWVACRFLSLLGFCGIFRASRSNEMV